MWKAPACFYISLVFCYNNIYYINAWLGLFICLLTFLRDEMSTDVLAAFLLAKSLFTAFWTEGKIIYKNQQF